MSKPMRRFAVLLIHGYRRYLGWMTHGCCRFTPSCSRYTEQAIVRYGLILGCCLAVYRLIRCHPMHAGGIDPVPTKPFFAWIRHQRENPS